MSSTLIDADQPLTVTDNIPATGVAPYNWLWVMSANGGPYGSAASKCTLAGGGNAVAGALETCAIAGNKLTAGNAYTFELQVSDDSPAIVDAATVGTNPSAVAFDTANGLIWVADNGSNNVEAIRMNAPSIVHTIAVGINPVALAYDPAVPAVYVANYGSNTVTEINTATLAVSTIAVGSNPWGVAYDSAKGEIFVANNVSGTVSVITTSSSTVTATVTVGSHPSGIAYDSVKGEVFVANYVGGTVSVISDTSNAVVATVTVGSDPTGVVYDPGAGQVWVANRGSGTLSVISDASNAVVQTVTVGTQPDGVAYDGVQDEVHVSVEGTNQVVSVSDSTDTIISTITVASQPDGLAYTGSGGDLWVAGYGANVVQELSVGTSTVVATVPVASCPMGAAFDSGKDEVFVANECSGTVSVISDTTDTVVATVGGFSEPLGLTYDSGKGEVWVSNYNGASVSVISDTTNAVVATISMCTDPQLLAYDSAKNEVYVASYSCGDVYVFSDATNTEVTTVGVGTEPYAVAYDSGASEIFVTNANSATVSVIADATNIVVKTISLPSGADPQGIAYDSSKSEVFVAGPGFSSVYVISDSTNLVVATLTGFSQVSALAYDATQGEMFVSDLGNPGTVFVVSDSTNSVGASVQVGSYPYGLTYDSNAGEAFAVNDGSDTVSVIAAGPSAFIGSIGGSTQLAGVTYDSGKKEVFVPSENTNAVDVFSATTNTLLTTISAGIGTQPIWAAYDSGLGEVFVSDFGSTSVSVISDSTNTVAATVTVGSDPTGLAYDSGKSEVFVANYALNTVSVISDASNTVVKTINVGNEPYAVAYDSGLGEVFVTNSNAASVSVISDTTNLVVATISVQTTPEGIAYDSGASELFVTNYNSADVSVISDATNAVVASITVGLSPWGVTYDSTRSEIFVANEASGTVSVISDTTNSLVTAVVVNGEPSGAAYGSGLGEVFSANFNLNVLDIISDAAISFQVSPASSSVTVNSALATPATPVPSGTALDVNQALTVSGTIPASGTPTYTWQWWASVNSGAYATTTLCAVSSGSGAISGQSVPCAIAANGLAVGSNYAFELQVSDSATVAESRTSAASSKVTVSAALAAPATPTVSAPLLDLDQALTVSGTLPTGGTPTDAWKWEVSINVAAYVATTQCVTNSGVGGSAGNPETCSIAANSLTAGSTYAFELVVTDSATLAEVGTSAASATVSVSTAMVVPSAPSVSATHLDVDQAFSATATIPVTGTAPYTYTWLVSINSGAFSTATFCSTNSGTAASGGTLETCSVAASSLTAGDTYAFELKVTDGATSGETKTTVTSSVVTVSAALTAASTPTVSAGALDVDQAMTVKSTLTSTGSVPLTWTWLVSINSASYVTATQCSVNSGSAPSGGVLETCSIAAATLTVGDTYAFEMQVTDSATAAEMKTSTASPTVSVSAALTSPSLPAVSATALDYDQALTVTSTLTSTGSDPLTWTWLVSINSGAFATATQCTVNSGSAAVGGVLETCPVAASSLIVGDTYAFELKVVDSATVSETKTSAASSTVTVRAALTVPSLPTVSSTALDYDQALTVKSTLTATGTDPLNWAWQVSINSASFVTATQCSVNSGSAPAGGVLETCTIAASTLIVGDTYAFEMQVSDSATAFELQTTAASPTVTVSAALTVPSLPTVTATALDRDQALTVQSTPTATGSDPLAWTWLVSVNGATFANAIQCAANSGSAPVGGVAVTCAVAVNTLTSGDTYAFKLKVVDSATTAETQTSLPSSTITVSPALTSPVTPSVSATSLDYDQALSVQTTLTATGTDPLNWGWLVSINSAGFVASTLCTINSGTAASGGVLETCSVPASTLTVGDTYAFQLTVTDSANSAETQTTLTSSTVTVSTALTAPSLPSVSATALDRDQALSVQSTLGSTGFDPLTWTWLVSVNGGAFVAATQCSINSGTAASGGVLETCSAATGTLTAGDTYAFELKVVDSATTAEVQPSAASATVTVSAALTAPSAPSVSATALDYDQALTVSSTLTATGSDPLSWTWLVSVNGATFATATQCSANSGTASSGGVLETCTVAASSLVVGDTYAFKLMVSDSATAPETQTALTSSTVTVHPAFTAPLAPSVSATALDNDQSLAITANVPAGGTPSYAWTWLVSLNGGAYAPTTQCSVNSGSGAAAGDPETCTVVGGTLAAGSNYAFELQVSDSATVAEVQPSPASSSVAVAGALVAGPSTPSSPALDSGQSVTLTAGDSGGTAAYTFQWYTGSSCTSPISLATSSTYLATPSTTITYYYEVTDHASVPEARCSPGNTVTVDSTFTAPAAPSVSANALDADQVSSAQGVLPLTGASPYSWQWLISQNAGAFVDATQCAANSGSGGLGGTTETCTIAANTLAAGSTYAFELQVTDGASTPVTLTSTTSSVVTVRSGLLAPLAPTVTATALDQDQQVTTSGTIPSTGTPAYGWTWIESTNGNPYQTATMCATDSGSGAVAGASETCIVAAGQLTPGSNYVFELKVIDSATNAEVRVSASSPTVAVAGALVPGSSSPASPLLDNGQSVTLTIGSSGGTSTFAYQWYTGAACTNPISLATSTTYLASPASTTTYYYRVTDSATTPEARCSAGNTVTVSPTLTAPSAPTPNAAVIDANQTLKVVGLVPLTGSAPYRWSWLVSINSGAFVAATQCAVNGGSGAPSGLGETCLIAGNTLVVGSSYAFEIQITDGANIPESATSTTSAVVSVSSTLSPPMAPTTSGSALDEDQALTVSGTLPSSGTAPYAWTWLVSIDGSAEAVATACATDSGTGAAAAAPESCVIAGGTLTAGSTYSFELSATDSASSPESSPSPASPTVATSATLTAAAISPGSPILDSGQSVTLTAVRTGGIAPFAFQWFTGAACTLPISGATAAYYLAAPTAPTTYYYAVTDSASTPEAKCSAGDTLNVNPALTAPATPALSASVLDADQALTVTGQLPSTGTSSYSWEWLTPLSWGTYVLATQCAVSSGTGALAGATEVCSIAGGALTGGSTYTFALSVSDSASTPEQTRSADSATVTVAPALVAGPIAPSLPTLDLGESVTLSVEPAGGTGPYAYQWFDAPGCSGPIPGATSTTLVASPLGSTTYSYQVTDSAATPESPCSPGDRVSVNAGLSAPSAPTVSGVVVDSDLSLTVSGTLPSSGTAPYGWSWLVSVDGAAFVPSTLCSANGGIGAPAGATVVCMTPKGTLPAGHSLAFELQVADSSWVSATATSSPSPQVTVEAPPTVSAPVGSVSSVDVGGTVVFQTTASGGSGTYATFTWLQSDSHLGCEAITSASISCIPTAPGIFTVSVNATDSLGGVTAEATSLPFQAFSLPSVTVPVTTLHEAYVGQKFNYTTSAQGGSGVYGDFRWAESAPGLGCTFTNLSEITCQAVSSGSYTVWVSVQDSDGGVSTTAPSLPLTVTSNLTVGAPVISPSVVDLGMPVNISAVVNGGIGTLVFAWTGLPAGCAPIAASFNCAPEEAGVFNISLTVRDQSGLSATSPFSRFVVAPLLTATASGAPSSAAVKVPIAFTAVWTGGTGPFTVLWRFGDGASSTSASTTHAYLVAGSYVAALWVNDSLGASELRLVVVAILPAPATTTQQVKLLGFSGTEAYVLVGGVAIALIVALELLFFVRRGRRTGSPPAKAKEEEPEEDPGPAPGKSGRAARLSSGGSESVPAREVPDSPSPRTFSAPLPALKEEIPSRVPEIPREESSPSTSAAKAEPSRSSGTDLLTPQVPEPARAPVPGSTPVVVPEPVPARVPEPAPPSPAEPLAVKAPQVEEAPAVMAPATIPEPTPPSAPEPVSEPAPAKTAGSFSAFTPAWSAEPTPDPETVEAPEPLVEPAPTPAPVEPLEPASSLRVPDPLSDPSPSGAPEPSFQLSPAGALDETPELVLPTDLQDGPSHAALSDPSPTAAEPSPELANPSPTKKATITYPNLPSWADLEGDGSSAPPGGN